MSLLSDLRDHDTIRQFRRSGKQKLPRWVMPAVFALAVVSLIPLVLIARSRVTTSTEPRTQIFPDMDKQDRFSTQTANPFFADGRAMRAPATGTVAQGGLRDDSHLYLGKDDTEWVTTFPFRITAETMQRGRERFDIYCAPCHGLAGYGDGMIGARAEQLQEGTWIPPLSFHSAVVRGRTEGELFNTITNGVRTMPAYGPQIPIGDRWAIVAYVRALQRSQATVLDDVPENRRDRLR